MLPIPKLTDPETKFIRTLEGILVVVANGILVLVPIVTNSLSAATAVKYGVILNTGAVVARSVLKAVLAVAAKIGVPPATTFSSGAVPSGVMSSGAGALSALNLEEARGTSAQLRDLHLTSPLMHGPDIKRIQGAINEWRRTHAGAGAQISVDGQYGPETEHALGVTAFQLGCLHRDGRPVVQQVILDPSSRTPKQHERAKHRYEEQKKHGHGAEGSLRHAAQYIGVSENPPGSNTGHPEPDGWEANFGMHGVSWCGCFAGNMVLLAGGHVTSRCAYTPYIEADGKAGASGFESFTSELAHASPGDLVTYDWTGRKAFPEHVGIVESVDVHAGTVTAIEGNTGGTNPSDGGMVARVTRPFSAIVGFSRPRY